jgi:hypothetical protein
MSFLQFTTVKPLVNTSFTVKFAQETVEKEEKSEETMPKEMKLDLVEVEEKNNDDCECFSLIFNGPVDCRLPQKTYTLFHDSLGERQMFLVPVGEKTEGTGAQKKRVGYVYQAIFNRLKNT